MRFLIPLALIFSALSFPAAQKNGNAAPPPSSSSSGTSIPSTSRGMPSSISNFPSNPNQTGSRPIFFSGKVVLSDSGTPPEPVKIERVCGAQNPRVEAYTDSKGRFSFQIGQSAEMQDASVGGPPIGPTFNAGSPGAEALWGCDLQANLAGYRSDRISLSGTHYLDNPDVGTIILHRLSNVDGLTISATSALAPKDAKKAYEKALELDSKKKFDEAQKELEKAVAVYPRYAAAWFELGKVNEQHGLTEEARKAYQQSITADSKYLPPYSRLSWLALKDSKWQELADNTGRMLQLDPIDDADAYYLSSIANFQLQKFDIAEKSAREAVRLDPGKKNMRSRYILGMTLAANRAYAESAEALRSYLASPPADASDNDFIRKQLSEVEEAAKQEAPQGSPATEQTSEPEQPKQ